MKKISDQARKDLKPLLAKLKSKYSKNAESVRFF
jgi:hypothetical protein